MLADEQVNEQRSLEQDMEVTSALSLEKALPQSVPRLSGLCAQRSWVSCSGSGWAGGCLQLRPKARPQQRLQGSWLLSRPQFPQSHPPVPSVSLSANTCQASGLDRRLKRDAVWIVTSLGDRKCSTDLENDWAVDDTPAQNQMGPAVLGISSSGGDFGFFPQTLTLSAVFLSPLQSYHRGIWPHSPWEGGR